MKKTGKFLGIILITAVLAAFTACKDDEPEPQPHGAPYDHLGVNEIKGKNCVDACGLQDYRTPAQKLAFPKEINRYGAKANYTDTELRETADKIIDGFNALDAAYGIGSYAATIAKIDQLCVALAADGGCTWDGKIFGVHPNGHLADNDTMKMVLNMIKNGELSEDMGYAPNIIMQAP